MKKIGKWIVGIFVALLFLVQAGGVRAADAGYTINNFASKITLEQDSSLTVIEKIEVNYAVEKHGIYRVIPYVYNHKKKIVRAKIKVVSVTNENGAPIPYTVENYKQSKKIKIGDANSLVSGAKSYVLTYNIKGVVLDYGNGPEIYWNVAGSEWEVPIPKVGAWVISPFGKIDKTECFGCASGWSEREANFDGKQDLTVVLQIDKDNKLKMPGWFERNSGLLLTILAYLAALAPLIVMGQFWFRKGRDKKYLTDNIYYEPEDKTETDVSLFERPHLPLVYSPINGYSPAEIGTIVDEKVDTKDIVAEIVDLARLGYLKIKKLESSGIFGIKDIDYELTRTKKTTEKLNVFQNNLLKDLFDAKNIEIEEGVEKASVGLKQIQKDLLKNIFDDERVTVDKIKISDLKNHFYKHLNGLKKDLYTVLADRKLTDGNFDDVRKKWMGINGLLTIITFSFTSFYFARMMGNIGPMILSTVLAILSLFLAAKMPRKTAKGYSLHRQADGLKYYLQKGKWREEIAEKHLFLEEMLPLAISLGVVSKLVKDMEELKIEPPRYFQGMAYNTFVRDLSHFNSVAAGGMTSSPSGKGSWSGGSGFSGGSGGGFGGGGGGSW